MTIDKKNLIKVDDYIWEIPKTFRDDMKVPVRVFASEKLLEDILKDESLSQAVNVATLPGIRKWSLVMPDIHEGYGAPVGAVFATDTSEGIISPGAVGYDINCGVRLLKSEASYEEVKDKIPALASAIYQEVPSGVGRGGRLSFSIRELDKFLKNGSEEMKKLGYATDEDIEKTESNGKLQEAEPGLISEEAKRRGKDQLGTIGAGNHFVEIQRIDKIYDYKAALSLGLKENQITIMIHCGSRGLGHQVATDYIKVMLRYLAKHDIVLPDNQLACAPFNSPEGKNYFAAMAAAANFAWANRQLISWEVRQAWRKILANQFGELKLVYDVAHNIAKIEHHFIDNSKNNFKKELLVHRKGATRSFVGQPVLIPGSMGTESFVLLGEPQSLQLSFGSTCHGAGRMMSRTKAKRIIRGSILREELEKKGISVRAGSFSGLAEEAPSAYKDVDEVVRVVEEVGLARRVCRLKPVGVIKG